MGIVIVLIFFAAAWLLLIVPRKRELRRHQLLMTQLEVGDDVITSSGVYGTIRTIDGEFVQLEVAPGVELKMAKRAVAAMAVDPEPDAPVVDLTNAEAPVAEDPVARDNREGPNGSDRPDVAGA